MKTFADFGINVAGKSGVEVKTLCPQCSHTRKKDTLPCLNVNLESGLFNCWHCGWGGSLKRGAYREEQPQKFYRAPSFTWQQLPHQVVAWFAKRAIPDTVLLRNKINYGTVYMPQVEAEVSAIQFPYFRHGEIVNIKYRDGRKNFRMASGAERILYGLDDISGDTLLICEGEIDKLSLEVAGYTSVVSVPDGAPAPESKSYEHKFDFLASAEDLLKPLRRIILAVDNDAPGKRLAEELARRLGAERCHTVRWSADCKDANDVLVQHGADILRECIESAEPWPVSGIADTERLRAAISGIYTHGMQRGLSAGWESLNQYYRVGTGEFTVITGVPGHGKTFFLSALVVNMAKLYGWRFTLFSPENYPLERYCARLLEQCTGKPFDGAPDRMNEREMETARDWLLQHVSFILPEDDSPTIDWLLELARVQVYREGIKGFVLDPWNEIEHARPLHVTETEYISQSLTKIRRFARLHNVHVWIVAHPTKLSKATTGDYAGQYPPPTPYDIAASAHWRNKADNCLTIWRDVDAPDHLVSIFIQKIRYRENGQLGMVYLRFNPACSQYEEVRDPIYADPDMPRWAQEQED